MSIHLSAMQGEIADKVILPGDPMRAKFIAENILEDAKCYNQVRGMYGFTGNYKGKRVSVQGTGMGIPSISIYVHELINDYGVKNLIRIGTCGAVKEDIKVRDLVIAMSASTDSNINKLRFNGADFAPTANFDLLRKAYEESKRLGLNSHVGSVLTSDTFYSDDENDWMKWADFGILALEMEVAGLYTLASKFGVNALGIMTVSDHIVTGAHTSSEEREKTFLEMAKLALEII